MADVKGLVRGLATWQAVSFYIMAGLALGSLFVWGRKRAVAFLAGGLLWGSALTMGLLLILGAGALLNFDALFTHFHVFSFSNDFWRLASNDYLILMFPEGFFLDATLIVAGLTFGQAVITLMVTGGILRKGARSRR